MDRVLVPSPCFDDGFRLDHVMEEFCFQALVAQAAVKRLVEPVLARRSRFDIERFRDDPCEPFSDGNRSKIRSVVETDMIWHAALNSQCTEHFKQMLSVQPVFHFDGQLLSCEFINDGEHTELMSVPRSVLD
ncbi:MAG: hypothetical protein AAF668_07460 [Pseudomonadota bacterium]